jgi:hypothetical protein
MTVETRQPLEGFPLERSKVVPLARPLPSGERSDRLACEAIRVRGQVPIERFLPPHPNPLPNGERERACVRGNVVPQFERETL